MALWIFRGLIGLGCVSAQVERYHRVEQYVGKDFFKYWNFYTGADPTHGTVQFVSEWEGWQDKLLSASEYGVIMRVDNTSKVEGEGGRKAVRIESKNSYNGGLFVLTLDNVPTACGAWPAFWMFGDDSQHSWPRWGEYDILESIHTLNYATTTLHTRRSCDQREVNKDIDFVGQGWATGALGTNKAKNCWVKAPQEFNNQGCGQKLPDGSFGAKFNQNGGGTFVAEWEKEGRKMMRTWFFPKGQEPIDLVAKSPQPDMWGTPNSFFTLNERWCTADHFKNMRMVFDTTFCGDYAGSTFASNCPWIKESCEEYVRKSPSAFSNAFWNIKQLDVYQKVDAAQLAAQAPAFVLHSDDQKGGNGGLISFLLFVSVMCTAGGVLYYFYRQNEKVKGKVDEYAAAAGLPEAWTWTKESFGRVKTSLTESLRRQGCVESDGETESPTSSPKRHRRSNSREVRTPPSSPQGAAPAMMHTPSMGHRPSLRQGQPGHARVLSGSITGSSNPSTLQTVARAAQPDAHQVPQPYIYSHGMMPLNASRELSGALPQPDSSRQNSASSVFQATISSGRMQAMGSGHLTHASSGSGRISSVPRPAAVTYTTRRT